MAAKDIDIFGRKTFFIAPDASLIPESYLEEFCARGYEAHIINDDYTCQMREKVEVIIREFPDSILFFNIDSQVYGIEWKKYIQELRKKHEEDALIGVVYLKRPSAKQKEQLDQYYVRDLGIRAGCIPLQAHHKENFEVMIRVLEQAGAKGRRNYIRAYCDNKSEVAFLFGRQKLKAKLADVNITHFRALFSEPLDGVKIYEKVLGAELKINGLKIVTDAVLIMKRSKDGVNTGVFMFTHAPDDAPDLSDDLRPLVNRKIYQIVAEETLERLKKEFKKADK